LFPVFLQHLCFFLCLFQMFGFRNPIHNSPMCLKYLYESVMYGHTFAFVNWTVVIAQMYTCMIECKCDCMSVSKCWHVHSHKPTHPLQYLHSHIHTHGQNHAAHTLTCMVVARIRHDAFNVLWLSFGVSKAINMCLLLFLHGHNIGSYFIMFLVYAFLGCGYICGVSYKPFKMVFLVNFLHYKVVYKR